MVRNFLDGVQILLDIPMKRSPAGDELLIDQDGLSPTLVNTNASSFLVQLK
jgi:hypothetical protein